jgi:two-component system phosphate regulon sensor histidine kinase PhoR
LAEQQPVSGGQKTDDSLAHRNKLLTQEIRRRVDQLSAINTVAAAISQSLDLEITLQTALDSVLGVITVEAAGISLIDEAAGELVLRAQRGWKYDFVTNPMRIPLGRGMSGSVIENDEVLITADPSADPRLIVPEFAEEGVQAMVMVPMHARGRVVGILSVMSYQPYHFTDEEITVLCAIADQVGVALDNARLYENTKEQTSRLGAVLNSSGDAIIATNNWGHISLINATAESMLNIIAEEMVGQALRDAPLHPRLREGLRRAMSNEAGGNTVFEITLEDGRFLSGIVSPVYAYQSPESSQEAEGWVMVVRDVTHLREAEQTRMDFIRAAAHDLRNPLSAAMGALAILDKDRETMPDLHQELVDIARQSVDRMQDLIDGLLNLERIESGVGLQSRPVDVRDLVERGVIDIQPSIQQRRQILKLDVPDHLPLIQGDIHWLHHALMNLLSNANKYALSGGTITIRAYVEDDRLVLEVEDNGPGVLPGEQARLFERFYRAPSTEEKARGSGLGLAIVKSVVERHGGRVFVQSRVGQGSIFGMCFPLADDE